MKHKKIGCGDDVHKGFAFVPLIIMVCAILAVSAVAFFAFSAHKATEKNANIATTSNTLNTNDSAAQTLTLNEHPNVNGEIPASVSNLASGETVYNIRGTNIGRQARGL